MPRVGAYGLGSQVRQDEETVLYDDPDGDFQITMADVDRAIMVARRRIGPEYAALLEAEPLDEETEGARMRAATVHEPPAVSKESSDNMIDRIVLGFMQPLTRAIELLANKEPSPVKMPDIQINIPEQTPPNVQTQVDVHVPKELASREAPQIVVNVPEQEPPQVTVEGPQIDVNIPEQEAPQVTINVPEQEPPQVTVEGANIDVKIPEQPMNVTLDVELQSPDESLETETVVERDNRGIIQRIKRYTRKTN